MTEKQETEEISPLFKLDVVLMFLYINSAYMQSLDGIVKGIFDKIASDDNEIAIILRKLEKDGFVIKHPLKTPYTESGTPRVRIEYQFTITFDGKIFSKQGGYTLEDIHSREQNTRLEKLELATMANRKLTTGLTVLIAVGTLVAAIYYMIEILDKFSHVLHSHDYFWIWETIPKKI